jgi:hypothetical protein
MKLPSIITVLLAASIVFAASSVRAGDPPPFPGQPRINTALKNLHDAKDKAAGDSAGALNNLHAAEMAVAHASHNKGTFQILAKGLITQAGHYLETGDLDKALHKIDEAIDAVTKAGGIGDH